MEFPTLLSNLLCEENISSLRDENDGSSSVSESDCEFIEMLFETETAFRPDGDSNSVLTEWWCLESVRSNVINWILEKRALFGYHCRTAYLSMVYFDRFLTRIPISAGNMKKIQILSSACLSLAAKMEECEARPLADYTREGYQLDTSSIKRMELIVLDTLGWRMCCVTPFTFLNYFAAKFCGERRDQELISRAKQLSLSIMEEIDVATHPPSIIAAAAVLAAYENGLSKAALRSKMDAVPSWGSAEKESAISCYSLLQGTLELETPESTVSHNPLNDTVVANDDSTSTRRSTRRRLNFDDHDQEDFPPQNTSEE